MESDRTGGRDAWLPAALVTLGAVELGSLGGPGWTAAAGLEAVAGLLLVLRRRHPLAVAPASTAVLLSIPWVGPRLDEVATPILFVVLAVFSLARWIADLRGVAGLAAILGLFLLEYAVVDQRDHDWTDVMFVLSLVVPPYVLGRVVRRLGDQARLLEEQQELIRDQAITAERERIARELHDVLAHSLSAMVVQTAAAQDLVGRSPERAAEMLASVADTGRRALQETGRLLHLIRDDGDELALHPAPGLADLPALLEERRAAGLTVDASILPPEAPLPGGVDVSAYRIVQEVLTNALRHGDGAAHLLVEVRRDEVRIECSNRVGRSWSTGSGLGLAGMAERVSLLGGTMRSARIDDTYRVAVRIPLPVPVAP